MSNPLQSLKQVFITGGAGFIGRWLAGTFVKHGSEVAIYDNFVTGRLENLSPFQDRIRVHTGDILHPDVLRAAIRECRPDALFHLAAHHYIPYCNQHPLETLRVNVEGTHAVLQVAAELKVPRVVIISSGALYADSEAPLSEDRDIAQPTDIYGSSKMFTEHLAHFLTRSAGWRCIVVRLFNTYGPYESTPHLIPHIFNSLRNGTRLELGNLETQRDYVYVEDAAILLAQLAAYAEPGCTIVNLGTGQQYSARQIVQELSGLLNRQIEVTVDPARVRATDKLHQKADISKMVRLSRRAPEYPLREGLRKYAEHVGLL